MTKPDEDVFTPPTKRAGLSKRGPERCPWSPCPCDGARAARLRRGALGMPEGSVRTVGESVTAFLTDEKLAISRERKLSGRPNDGSSGVEKFPIRPEFS